MPCGRASRVDQASTDSSARRVAAARRLAEQPFPRGAPEMAPRWQRARNREESGPGLATGVGDRERGRSSPAVPFDSDLGGRCRGRSGDAAVTLLPRTQSLAIWLEYNAAAAVRPPAPGAARSKHGLDGFPAAEPPSGVNRVRTTSPTTLIPTLPGDASPSLFLAIVCQPSRFSGR